MTVFNFITFPAENGFNIKTTVADVDTYTSMSAVNAAMYIKAAQGVLEGTLGEPTRTVEVDFGETIMGIFPQVFAEGVTYSSYESLAFTRTDAEEGEDPAVEIVVGEKDGVVYFSCGSTASLEQVMEEPENALFSGVRVEKGDLAGFITTIEMALAKVEAGEEFCTEEIPEDAE